MRSGKRGVREGISRAALGKFAVAVQSSTNQFLYHVIQMIIAIVIVINGKFCIESWIACNKNLKISRKLN